MCRPDSRLYVANTPFCSYWGTLASRFKSTTCFIHNCHLPTSIFDRYHHTTEDLRCCMYLVITKIVVCWMCRVTPMLSYNFRESANPILNIPINVYPSGKTGEKDSKSPIKFGRTSNEEISPFAIYIFSLRCLFYKDSYKAQSPDHLGLILQRDISTLWEIIQLKEKLLITHNHKGIFSTQFHPKKFIRKKRNFESSWLNPNENLRI